MTGNRGALGGPTNQPHIGTGTQARVQAAPPGVLGLAASATPRDGSRGVTPGEMAMARLLFVDSVNYACIRVHNRGFFPPGLQDENTAVTPNGDMYFPQRHFREDFSTGTGADKHWFIHEMVHVWQYQLGYHVMLRGMIRFGLDYRYTLDDQRVLGDYNMEAQGDVLADYHALKFLKNEAVVRSRDDANGRRPYTLAAYERTLRDFIANPSDRSNLP